MRDRDWICHWCMGIQKGPSWPEPSSCPCGVLRCTACKTFRRNERPFCHGCGRTDAGTEPAFCPADATASHYLADRWAKLTLGKHAKGPFTIWTRLLEGGGWVHQVCRGEPNDRTTERDLSDAEADLLGLPRNPLRDKEGA